MFRWRGVGRITGMQDMCYRRGSGVRPRRRREPARIKRHLPRGDVRDWGGRRWG